MNQPVALQMQHQMLQSRVAQGEAALRQIEQAKAVAEMQLADDREALATCRQRMAEATAQLNAVPPGYVLQQQVGTQVYPQVQIPPGYQLVPIQPQAPVPQPQPQQREAIDHPTMRPVMLGPEGAGLIAQHGTGSGVPGHYFGGVATDGMGMAAEEV